MFEPIPELWLFPNFAQALVTMDSEKLPTSPQEKKSTEPDSSSDSSTSRKQLKVMKSPHTIPKCSSNLSERKCCVNNGLRLLRSPQNEDRSEHYELLLQETKQTLSSRDTLIYMLQEQLKKIENLYKQSLDDTQELRFKYCVTTQELSTVRTICDKYREDIEVLIKENDGSDANKEISKLQKEIENWKARYEELLTWARLDIKSEQKKETEPKEAQSELMQTNELKNCIATLTEQYTCVKLTLQQQNEKLELLVRKLPRDGGPFEEDELSKSLQVENNNLKQHLENLKTENERLLQLEQAKDFIVEEIPSRLLANQNLDNIKDNEQIEHLRDELKTLQEQTQKLTEKNVQLQLLIDQSSNQNKPSNENVANQNNQHELENLKNQIKLLTEKNAELQSERSELTKTTEHNARFIQDQIQNLPDVPSGSIVDEETLISNLEKDQGGNSLICVEIDSLKSSPKTPTDLKECVCANNKADIDSKRPVDFKECISCPNNASNNAGKIHHNSKVIFAGGNLHLEEELNELNRENSRLKVIIKDLKGDDRRSEQMEKFTVELVTLRRQLKQAQEEIERLTQDSRSTADRKNEIIENLRHQEELLKNDYDDLLKENALIASDLKNKNVEINEKEKTLENLYAEIQELQTTLNTNHSNDALVKDALQEAAEVKDELNNKIKELDEITAQFQSLQAKTEELETMLGNAIDQNEEYNNEAKNHSKCQDIIHKLQTELYTSTQLAEELNCDNESLRIQIDEMTKTLQQYREEAAFTKLENEKLRKKEEHMQYSVTCSRNSNDNLVKECGKELEKTQSLLCKITSEYKNFKLDCQTKLSQSDNENAQLQELLSARDDEIKALKEKLDTITKELHLVMSRHEKDLSGHEKSLSEISVLFKCKEDELAATENILQEQQEYLKTLEEENKKLKTIISEKTPSSDAEETARQNQIKEFSILQENYQNEKAKTLELNTILNNIHKEFQDLKMQLQEFLKKLESKLMQLKIDTKENTSPSNPTLTKIISEILTDLERFSKGLTPSGNNQNIKETERFSYFYEDIKSNGGKTESNLKNVHTELGSHFDCTVTDCNHKNIIKSTDNLLFTNFMIKNEAAKSLELSSMTPAELVSKREYLVKKVESIDKKLNVPATNSYIKSPTISSASDISSPIKSSENHTVCGCKQSTEELIFKQKYYSNKINLIDDKLKAFSNIINENQICTSAPIEDKNSLTNTYWKKNFQMIQQIASDVNELKMGLTAKSNNTEYFSQQECSLQNCTHTNSLQLQVKNLQEQANATYLMSQQIHELEMQLELQQTKLQEYTIQRCAENIPNCKAPPSCILFAKTKCEQTEDAPKVAKIEESLHTRTNVAQIMELPKSNLPQPPAKLQTHSCAKTDFNNAEIEKAMHENGNEENAEYCVKNAREPINDISTPAPNLSKKTKCKCGISLLPKMKPNCCCVKQGSRCSEQGRREIALPTVCEKPPTGQLNTDTRGVSSQTHKCRKSCQSKESGNLPRKVFPCECLTTPLHGKCKPEMKTVKNNCCHRPNEEVKKLY